MKQNKHAARRKIKPYIVNRCIILSALIAILVALIGCASVGTDGGESQPETANRPAEELVTAPMSTTTAPTPETPHSASSEASETSEPTSFFFITDEERELIEQVVSAEARGEPHEGQVAVAECILNACKKDGIRPAEAIISYQYTTARANPTQSVRLAVAEVFDEGKLITEEPILYFYNPAYGTSEFHESQTLVMEIGNHRFFKEVNT